jgi:hypothetical protein
MRLFLLASAGLLAADPGPAAEYRYLADPRLEPLAEQIAEIHAREPLLLHQVLAPADPARQLADAFRLRKRP